jgi:hypothetical protein
LWRRLIAADREGFEASEEFAAKFLAFAMGRTRQGVLSSAAS